jgi:branched-chain amino acid transport system ATP-binding protein
MLEIQNIHTFYGDSHILQGISFEVRPREVVALLGRNGMGKTTTLRSIMGLNRPKSGEIILEKEKITQLQTFEIARRGIGYVPEDRGIFGSLTVFQNLSIPFYNKMVKGNWAKELDKTYELFPILKARASFLASGLSGGEQQMLATARGLLAGHRMIIMDEPTEGLAPTIVQKLIEVFKRIKEADATVLLVEQNVNTAFEIADRCYLIEKGMIQIEDTISRIKQRPDVLHKFLGIRSSGQ